MTPQTPLCVFLHLPKTAGTSFNTYLTREFGRRHVLHTPNADIRDGSATYLALPPQRQAAVRLVRGHILHGLHTHVDRPVRYFTLLRDPLSRLRSYYNHIASEAAMRPDLSTPWFDAVRDWTDAESFVARSARQSDNYMVRALSGVRFPRGGCTDEILAQAIANLDSMAAFGIHERLNESACLIAADMGFRALPVLTRTKSGNPPRIRLTETDEAFLRDLNRYDVALYAHACRRLEERLAAEPGIVARAEFYRRLTPVASGVEGALRRARGLVGGRR